MLVSLTVGKVDAGVAVLLTEDKRLVSVQRLLSIRIHPSIHLPIPERIIVYKQDEDILYVRRWNANHSSYLDRIPLHPPPA